MRKNSNRWVYEALKDNEGVATVLEVAKHIWLHHKDEIEGTESFYSWQYDFRWGATDLRKKGIMKEANRSQEEFGN
jgi:hypothetical protein